MKKKLIFFLTCLPFCTFSQSLLLNGGFEEENLCTEYSIACAPEAWIISNGNADTYVKDATRAYRGNNCIALEAGHSVKPFQRNFIRTQLLCGLRKGAKYRLEFYVKSRHQILDSLGVYFGDVEPLLERKPIHKLAPSLFLGDFQSFRNDSSWQKVVLEYTAKGNERYFTIANFSRNDINGNTGQGLVNRFYFYVDELTLVPMNPKEKLCNNWKIIRDEIYEQNERHEYLQRSLRFQRTAPLNLPVSPGRVSVIDTLILPDIFFATSMRDLTPISFAKLDSFCRSIAGKTIDSLVIEGHTDDRGNADSNEQLGMDRAGAVSSYLRNCAFFFRVPFYTRGWGSRRPVTNNDTPENRQRNRRVELFLYLRE